MVIAMREICRRDKGTEVPAAPEPNALTYNVCQMASSLSKMVLGTMPSGEMERNTIEALSSLQEESTNFIWLIVTDGVNYYGTWKNDT